MANAHRRDRRDRVGVTGWNVGVRGEAVEEARGGRDSPTMPLSAIALVLLSALLHASWNLLLKRAGGTQEVVALSKIVEVVLFAPVFVWGFAADLPEAATVAWFTAVAATGVGLNYLFLARAYRHGELSVVYPISRGAILAFLPVAGWFALGERVAPLGVAGLLAIVCGILVLNLPEWSRSAVRGLATSLRGRATLYSIAAGFVAAGYTVWDKRAVAVMAPFAYMYLYTVLVALGYGVWLATRVASGATRQAWARARAEHCRHRGDEHGVVPAHPARVAHRRHQLRAGDAPGEHRGRGVDGMGAATRAGCRSHAWPGSSSSWPGASR
jgi:drug/metabolite transporter (DMT)-like permease